MDCDDVDALLASDAGERVDNEAGPAAEVSTTDESGAAAVDGPTGERPAVARVGRHHKGGNKWQSEQPVPWPNLFWPVFPKLVHRVSRLEAKGYVHHYQQKLQEDDADFALFCTQQREYAALRWATLTEDGRAYCESNCRGAGMYRATRLRAV